MAPTIQQIIAAVNPNLYYDYGGDKNKLRKFKELIKQKGPYNAVKELLEKGEEVKPQAIKFSYKVPGKLKEEFHSFNFDSNGKESKHTLIYDSSTETLEPVYFFILDLLNNFGLAPEKLADSFTSSPGSGHFAELGQRATIMQQQGTKTLADINTVLRSVLNIIYDLKEFKIRLQSYEGLKSSDKEKQDAALLSLKQIWMDKVDIAKGNSSIKAMALGQAGFQTLIDAFLASKDEKDILKLDLGDRVKRILLPRINEFNVWVKQSESELKKRYQLERTYLKSQVNSLKLYSRWAKPYLRTASELESGEIGRRPELVKAFNTIMLDLTLLGKIKLDIEGASSKGEIPTQLRKLKTRRDYFTCILVDLKFRGIPQRVSAQQAHYVFGGRAEINFRAYALNKDELDKIDKELDKSDIGETLKLIEGATTESLSQLEEDINLFLGNEEEEEIKEKAKGSSNPFLALIGYYNKKPEKISKKKDEIIKPDNFIEKTHLRNVAGATAIEMNFKLFDTYKKVHGMPSFT